MTTRRRFLLSSTSTLALASCEREDEGQPELPKELRVFIWADYIKPELVKRFETEHNCKVVIDTFDSNEAMYAKLKAGATGYDIAVPSSYMVKLMHQQMMLNDIVPGMAPNLRHISGDIANKVYDKLFKVSVPYAVGCTVIAYRKDKIKEPEASWMLFDRADLNPKTTLLNDMRETLGAALRTQGFSINSRDEVELGQARDLVIRWKKNTAKFDNEAYKAGIDSGEFSAVMGYSGDLFQVVAENPQVGILLPKEGVVISCDEFVILKEAPNPFLAHEFINFMLEPNVSAENMEHIGYRCPNKEAMNIVSPSFLSNPVIKIPDEVMNRSEIIEDLGDDLPKWTKAWDAAKAG